MNNRISLLSISLAMIMSVSVFGGTTNYSINKEELNHGVLSVDYEPQDLNGQKMKVRIVKDNNPYVYDLSPGIPYPLQLGDGNYTVSILQQHDGKTYKALKQEEVSFEAITEHSPFLEPIQNIFWDNETKVQGLVKDITKNTITDKQKVAAIYKYVTSNIRYDHQKAITVESGYLPDADRTILEGKGICYDYASLVGVMLRLSGVPTKLIMGYNKDIAPYHAWNEVYISEDDEWVIIDTTYDAGKIKGSFAEMMKDKSQYQVQRVY